MRRATLLVAALALLVAAGAGREDGSAVPDGGDADAGAADGGLPDGDRELIEHLDEIENLDLLQNLELFDTGAK